MVFQIFRVKFSIRISSSLRRFYFLKGVIWLSLGLGLGLGFGLVLGLGLVLCIDITTPELHIRMLHLGRYFLKNGGPVF
jgi:hypothetical protein